MTREEHLKWCKQRALEYVDAGDIQNAFASMVSDLGEHDETRGHIGIELGSAMLFGGHMNTLPEARKWIEGFN